LALATFLEFGLKWAKGLEGRPARVEVRAAKLRDALAAPLAILDTTVGLVDELPAVRDALRNLEEQSTGERLPGLLESPGMSVDRVRAFADVGPRVLRLARGVRAQLSRMDARCENATRLVQFDRPVKLIS
jgi:hypothetical protein